MASTTRFTEKSQEAIVNAQRDTESRSISQFEPITLLLALLDQVRRDGAPFLEYLDIGGGLGVIRLVRDLLVGTTPGSLIYQVVLLVVNAGLAVLVVVRLRALRRRPPPPL